ncbi:MAG: hypothetical protein JO061_21995 [Acidobacteriaceae bacterium]|nr:hypothetical protein [Acidobacteriaceae bacterium]
MSSKVMQEVVQMIEAEVQSRSTALDYELAYQARVAIDRIRFAIRHIEEFAPRTDQMREAGLELLDALDRLQNADRRFQQRFRAPAMNGKARPIRSVDDELKTCANGGRS